MFLKIGNTFKVLPSVLGIADDTLIIVMIVI